MDHKEYTKFLTDLFKDCSIKVYENKDDIRNYRNSGNYTHQVETMFKETSGAFNSTLASKYVQKLKEDFPHITQKLDNYPEIFWHTNQREEHIKEGFDNLIKHELSPLFSISERMFSRNSKVRIDIAEEFKNGILAIPNLLNKCEDVSKKLVDNPKNFEWVDIYTKNLQQIIHTVMHVQNLFKEIKLDIPLDLSGVKEHINKKHDDRGLREHFVRVIEEIEQKNSEPTSSPRNKM